MREHRIGQTLHGYQHGHRLLANSGGFTDSELAILDRLSDLSGYLPPKTVFSRYYTGFPCGRFYALACTYPDLKAKRAGTVLTHTLLFPLEAVEMLDLGALLDLHRPPISSDDRAPYQEAIEWTPYFNRPHAPNIIQDERLRMISALFFGQSERPILWQDAEPTITLLAQLWYLLWPAIRQQFSFCTFALQVRSVGQRFFDFLALPDSARGSFHEVSSLSSWFVHGQLPSPAARGLLHESWMLELELGGVGWIADRLEFARRAHILSPLATDLPVLRRIEDLLGQAPKRLSAARAFADLLQGRFSELGWEHPLWLEATEQLLRHQGDAPLSPRPLWEMVDFLERSSVKARSASQAEFSSRVETMLETQLVIRLSAEHDRAVAALPNLVRAAQISGWRKSVLQALETLTLRADTLADAARYAKGFLKTAFALRDLELGAAALRPLTADDRLAVVKMLMVDKGEEELQGHFIAGVAQLLDDPLLAFEGAVLAGSPELGLRNITAATWANPTSEIGLLRKVLPRFSAIDRLTWSFQCIGPAAVTGFAVREGVDAASHLRLPLLELAKQVNADISIQATRVFAAYADCITNHADKSKALQEYPGLCFQCVLLGLLDPVSQGIDHIAADALLEMQPTYLLSLELCNALAQTTDSYYRSRVVSRVFPYLLKEVTERRIDAQTEAAWLRSEAINVWFQEADRRWEIFSCFPGGRPAVSTLPILSDRLALSLGQPESLAPSWLGRLLEAPLRAASVQTLEEAVQGILRLLDLPLRDLARKELAAQVIEATRRLQPPSGYLLIGRTFALIYFDLLGNRDTLVRRILTYVMDGWDRGKAWRHFLVDAWIKNEWPPEAFLQLLEPMDGKFLRDLAEHAAESKAGRRFLLQLLATARGDSSLGSRWNSPLCNVLRANKIAIPPE